MINQEGCSIDLARRTRLHYSCRIEPGTEVPRYTRSRCAPGPRHEAATLQPRNRSNGAAAPLGLFLSPTHHSLYFIHLDLDTWRAVVCYFHVQVIGSNPGWRQTLPVQPPVEAKKRLRFHFRIAAFEASKNGYGFILRLTTKPSLRDPASIEFYTPWVQSLLD